MPITPEQALAATAAGASSRVAQPIAPKFKVGDHVLVNNINPPGHTRMPRYIRGKRGVIERDYGVFVFPDSYVAGLGERPQHVYSVRFSSHELWGTNGVVNDELLVDVWDDYMERA